MNITIIQLNKLAFKAKQAAHKRVIMKQRVKAAGFFKHIQTCGHCKGMFTGLMEAKAFQDASEETENLMTSLLSKSLH